ncbi:hypothetical protein SELMODRAFT_442699 [Selaginella moellendorffii]|uniref:Uncharacterized protein n=1 Tax=Selaginella moellendorffii TaxID=88036 RepID=D8RVE4_SELML|nr:outer envelope protein 61 [Selaginella moellendorffii]EFJ23762.1 hypothetical protein SELMODRAFT_442699 [Selaginella moellendorffii]|eukprot:XP_002974977.1 outer envelope protein 61 [Selaginella moellendorffii]
MMDPEMIRLAQEQMSRIPPAELLRMQQQMMGNPDLLRMATEGMKNIRPEDLRFAAEQMKNMPSEQIADMSARMANASPEQIAAMNGDATALMLKNQGNQLHGSGQFYEAIDKYKEAKLKSLGVSSAAASNLRVTCSLNLMSCYLKTSQYSKAISEGSEVLATEPRNLKALYRRGQAYKELGKLKLAVADLTEAAAVAPDDETVADVLRVAKEELEREGDNVEKVEKEDDYVQHNSDGPIIEEITEEEAERLTSTVSTRREGVANRATEGETMPREASTSSFSGMSPPNDQAYAEAIKSMKQNPELLRNMQSTMSSVDPEQLAAMSGGKMTPEMAKFAADLMKHMSPSDLERMVDMASGLNLNGGAPSSSSSGPEPTRPAAPSASTVPFQPSPGMLQPDEQMRRQMKDPAMRELMSSMIKSMTPESMASMSEQLGLQLTPEQAVAAQKAMANLTPDQLDRLMRWTERAQTVTEQAKRAKAWIVGKPGLMLAILMLLVAIVLHYLGFIG